MIEALTALVATTFLLLGSPGPAPLALAATGAGYGVRAGIPFLLGILTGLAVAIVAASLGLAVLFSNFPSLRTAVQLLGSCYIAYIAYKIASGPILSDEGDAKPAVPNFVDGLILNLLNPKAYAAFLAIFAQFLLPLDQHWLSYASTATVCFAVAVLVDVLWLCSGSLIRPLFKRPRQARMLRIGFAAAMLLAVIIALGA